MPQARLVLHQFDANLDTFWKEAVHTAKCDVFSEWEGDSEICLPHVCVAYQVQVNHRPQSIVSTRSQEICHTHTHKAVKMKKITFMQLVSQRFRWCVQSPKHLLRQNCGTTDAVVEH